MKTILINTHPTNWFKPFSDLEFFEAERTTPIKQVIENINETAFAYKIEYLIPEKNKKDLKIKIENNKLILEAYRKEPPFKLFRKNKNIKESSFIISKEITRDMDDANISAKFKKGVLLIDIPKKKEFINYREIPVSESEGALKEENHKKVYST